MAEKPCGFCDPAKNLKQPPFKHHLTEFGIPGLHFVPLFETDNIVVYPDVLPTEPGGRHLLVVSNRHVQAFAHRPDLKDELGYVIARVEEEFGIPFIVAEHGGGDQKNGYTKVGFQSVHHAHIHLVGNPERLAVLDYMMDGLRQKEKILFQIVNGVDGTPTPQLLTRYNGHPYLYIQQGNVAIWAEDKGGRYPSQITQRHLSKLLNAGHELNWKEIPQRPDLARLSAQRIVSLVEACRL